MKTRWTSLGENTWPMTVRTRGRSLVAGWHPKLAHIARDLDASGFAVQGCRLRFGGSVEAGHGIVIMSGAIGGVTSLLGARIADARSACGRDGQTGNGARMRGRGVGREPAGEAREEGGGLAKREERRQAISTGGQESGPAQRLPDSLSRRLSKADFSAIFV